MKAFLTTVHAPLQALIFLALAAEPFVASLTQIHARPGIIQACNFATFIAKAEDVNAKAEGTHLNSYLFQFLVLKLGSTSELSSIGHLFPALKIAGKGWHRPFRYRLSTLSSRGRKCTNH
jgi:hypothetical protein